jgi:hypothetical protein
VPGKFVVNMGGAAKHDVGISRVRFQGAKIFF